MLPVAFREQSKKWKDVTLAHVSNAILIVHHFIHVALKEACPDDGVRDQLRLFIMNDLVDCYQRAMDHSSFLLRIECEGKAITCNPMFEDCLRKNRQIRQQQKTAKVAESMQVVQGKSYVPRSNMMAAMSSSVPDADQICDDLHDVLKAYYEVARARFVDAIYQQVVDHFMLSDSRSALRVFGPERVLSMSSEQLRSITEEEPSSKKTRETLEHEISFLKQAMLVLRG